MITLETYRRIQDIRPAWEKLYETSPLPLTPFSSYVYTYNCVQSLRWRFRGYELCPVCFYSKEGEKEAIFLLIENKNKHELTTISVYSPVDYYELLSNTTDLSFVKRSVVKIIELYEDYTIRFDSIHENSILYNLFKTLPSIVQNCVEIPVEDYDSYFRNLSKHQRQNIRTIYNRLENKKSIHKLEKYSYPIPDNALDAFRRGFFQRRLQRIYRGMHLKTKFKCWYNAICSWIKDPIIPNNTNLNKDVVIFLYKINSICVACIMGMYSKDRKTFFIPRLMGDRRYSEYSPGILMLNEVIKVLADEGVETIDLARGDEPYKFAMGGVYHYNYSFTLNDETIKKIL